MSGPANFSFSSESLLHLTQKKPEPRREVSYQFFVISDTKICKASESYLYLHQYPFCKSKNP